MAHTDTLVFVDEGRAMVLSDDGSEQTMADNVVILPLTAFRSERRVIKFRILDRKTREGRDLDGKLVLMTFRRDLAANTQFTLDTAKAGGISLSPQSDPVTRGEFTATITVVQSTIDVDVWVYDCWVNDEVVISPSPFDVRLASNQP